MSCYKNFRLASYILHYFKFPHKFKVYDLKSVDSKLN